MIRPHPFERTLRSLRRDQYGGALLWFGLTGVVLLLWGGWLWGSSVPVFVTSVEARLAVQGDSVRIDSRADGQLHQILVRVGDEVSRDQALFVLEATVERSRLQEAVAGREALQHQLEEARVELASRRREAIDRTVAKRAESDEARAALRAAETAASRAEAEAQRAEQLRNADLVSVSELEDLRATASQLSDRASESAGRVARLAAESAALQAEQDAALSEARRMVLRLEGELGSAHAAADRLAAEVDRRMVRSPADGIVAELAHPHEGPQISEGDHLATLLPETELRTIAYFDPARAAGRIRPGQAAEMRLDAFPWTEFGIVDLEVVEVATESRGGRLRVELDLLDLKHPGLTLSHGMPGTVMVRVEETSPWSLVLRTAGYRDTGGRSPPR